MENGGKYDCDSGCGKNNLPHDICYTPEQLALQSLVDSILEKSDEVVFSILTKILDVERKL